jgi:alpha-N-acetylglucosamine transferase
MVFGTKIRLETGKTCMNSYITLVANADYLMGAVALAKSLVMTGARYPLTALVIDDSISGLEELAANHCHLLKVDPLAVSDGFKARHSRGAQHSAAPFIKGEKPVFHDPLHNFVKLRLWELDQFETVVFLDADTLVIHNIDKLFGYPEFSAAPNLYESLADFHRLNSGVFVAKPSRRQYETMLMALDQPDLFWSRTDQTFLQTYFPDWHGLPYTFNTLQYVWFNMPQLWDWARVNVIHYQYEKPWQADHPKRAQLAPLIETWWRVYETGTLPPDLPLAPIGHQP